MSRLLVHFNVYECTAPIKLVLVMFWAECSTTESRNKPLFILRFCLGQREGCFRRHLQSVCVTKRRALTGWRIQLLRLEYFILYLKRTG